jgi:peptidoglycan/xylan/chitin deacetylase (PgdA/CDA1 family)/glycosyltransferase involved in cell wall biosynthesis
MKILHVLSQFEVTGAEVYAAELARRQTEKGHEIVIVSDTLTLEVPGRYLPFPIGKRTYPQRVRAIAFLVRLIRAEEISVIHAHSRAASWVSHFASLLTGVPMVSTVHGRQHMHASVRLFNVYGRHVIAVNGSLKSHLIDEVGIPPHRVVEIPNGISIHAGELPRVTKEEVFGRPSAEQIILFVGRLTGPKGNVVRFLVRDVMPALVRKAAVSLAIVGGQIVPEDIPELVRSSNRSIGREAVMLHGFRRDLRPFFATADLVIGSGRVALEAMLDATPALAFGESGYIGPITPATVSAAAGSNFGDTGTPRTVSAEEAMEEILRLLREGRIPQNTSCLREYVRTHFDVSLVEERIGTVYRQARALVPPNIPVLMYHRVVEASPAGSRHGIWVGAREFDSQLRSLKARNYTPITFRQYRAFLRDGRPLPQKPILLTFDDGYEDNYTVAFPLLQRYGFPAVVFLVADFSRRTNFWDPDEPSAPLLAADQIREMDRAGIEFGSHTVSHPHLTRIGRRQVQEELRRSKACVEELIGRPVYSLCYPYGDLNGSVKEDLFATGYEFGVAGDSGPLRFGDDPGEVRRAQVFPDTDRFGFWKKTHPWYARYRRSTGR